MAEGYELEALVNLKRLFNDTPLDSDGISILLDGWEQRLFISGSSGIPQGISSGNVLFGTCLRVDHPSQDSPSHAITRSSKLATWLENTAKSCSPFSAEAAEGEPM